MTIKKYTRISFKDGFFFTVNGRDLRTKFVRSVVRFFVNIPARSTDTVPSARSCVAVVVVVVRLLHLPPGPRRKNIRPFPTWCNSRVPPRIHRRFLPPCNQRRPFSTTFPLTRNKRNAEPKTRRCFEKLDQRRLKNNNIFAVRRKYTAGVARTSSFSNVLVTRFSRRR